MMSSPADVFAPWLGIFTTLRVEKGVPLFVREHWAEIERASQTLEIPFRLDLAREIRRLPRDSGRWRWIVRPGGVETLFTPENLAPAGPVTLSISPLRVGSLNWDARFKTVSRLTHLQAQRLASTAEVILLNERNEIASATRSNLFWRVGDRIFTPAHEAGCRRGVVRRFILSQQRVEEGFFPVADLFAADEIFLSNSLRGIVSVTVWEGRELRDFSAADQLRAAYEGEVARQVKVAEFSSSSD